ncbi:hypothetical protein MBRU_06210 [Mycolicibacterium brumae DSM 44177]|nr:hypothetical protein MBRU_06210 [Mycolicibacterium brumae DSM 44177]
MSAPTPEPDGDRAPGNPAARAMLEQVGGVSGLIYSALPILVLVPVNSQFGLVPAVGAALGVALLVLIWRLIRRESTQPAVSGFIGVGFGALIAYLVGSAKGYFLWGIWMSALWAAVFALSVLIRRPAVGYVWSWINGHGKDWRAVRKVLLAFDLATLTWVAVFAARFVVQRYLYDADETGWLGFARVAMGVPLTAVAAVITYFVIRHAQRELARSGLSEANPAGVEAADGQVADAEVADAEVAGAEVANGQVADARAVRGDSGA